MDISVIIPCLNEYKTIKECISRISHELDTVDLVYEIIVVDNGSIDGSDVVAKECHAIVIYSNSQTIAGVRNYGFSISRGRFIVFIDADIIVQNSWGYKVKIVFEHMKKNDYHITGSHPIAPDNMNPFLAAWYTSISQDTRNTYLGTGHMLLSRYNFIRVGKFNESLSSGEDFDFCRRAKMVGIKIYKDPSLKVYHLGYPDNVYNFIRREIWHGKGDCTNIKTLLQSPVASVGILFLAMHFFLLVFFFTNLKLFFVLLGITLFTIFFVNYYKFSYDNIIDFVKRSCVTYIYLLSRGLALPFNLLKKSVIKF